MLGTLRDRYGASTLAAAAADRFGHGERTGETDGGEASEASQASSDGSAPDGGEVSEASRASSGGSASDGGKEP